MNRQRKIVSGLDWWIVVLLFIISMFGWLNIYGAGYSFEQSSIWDFSNRAGKQLVWILSAWVMGIVVFSLDEKLYDSIAYLLYGGMVVLLVITPLFAHNIKGSYSWLTIGPVSIQPAEFAKCFTALALAKYMSRYEFRLKDWRDYMIPLVLIAVPMVIIIFLQRETGSALVFLSFALVFYRMGMNGRNLVFGVICIILSLITIRYGGIPLPIGKGHVGLLVSCLMIEAVLAIVLWLQERMPWMALISVGIAALCYGVGLLLTLFISVDFDLVAIITLVISIVFVGIAAILKRSGSFWLIAATIVIYIMICQGCDYAFQNILQPHQRARIEVLLGMRDDPTGAGYNVNQSLIAIGSGQLTGKGYLQGTQTKLQYVPEQDTDFIFCTVGEEWGFIGSVGLLLLYLILVWRIIHLGERQRDIFCRVFAYSVACMILFHVTVNIGMVLGRFPVIGIPLPFFSYGGSSIWGFGLMIAILLRLDAARINRLQ